MPVGQQPDVLLIHGAWHGAWCFTPLTEALELKGVRALAIDLPGHGERRDEAASWSGYVAATVEALDRFDEPPLVLGHSMGGAVITAAAEAAPDRIAGLIYLCAFLPADGESVMTLAQRGGAVDGAILDPSAGVITIPAEVGERVFYHDCPDPEVWARRLQPQAIAPTMEPVTVSAARWGSTPRAYIRCAQDKAINPDLQTEMAERAAPMLRLDMDCGHSPFLAAPDALADMILDAGRTILYDRTN